MITHTHTHSTRYKTEAIRTLERREEEDQVEEEQD